MSARTARPRRQELSSNRTLTFTLEPHIRPQVGRLMVPAGSVITEVARLFPECEAPKVEDGVDVISCQQGKTVLTKKGSAGDVEIHLVSLPPTDEKKKRARSAPK